MEFEKQELVEKLCEAVDSYLNYKTPGKLEELARIRNEMRKEDTFLDLQGKCCR